jgi:hypothetical protein
MSQKLVAELTDKLEQSKGRLAAQREKAKEAAENVVLIAATLGGGGTSGAVRHYLDGGHIPGTEIEADLVGGLLMLGMGFFEKTSGKAAPFLRGYGSGMLAGWASHAVPTLLDK